MDDEIDNKQSGDDCLPCPYKANHISLYATYHANIYTYPFYICLLHYR